MGAARHPPHQAMLLTSRRSDWVRDPGDALSLERLKSGRADGPGDASSPVRLESIRVEDPQETPHPREEWRWRGLDIPEAQEGEEGGEAPWLLTWETLS